jgi:sialic acid synthase SpsE
MPDKDETVKEGVVSRWTGRRWLDVYKATYLPWLDQVALKRFAEDIGLTFFASVYSPAAVDFWERNGGLPAYKVAEWQSEDAGLAVHILLTGKPCMVSRQKRLKYNLALLNGIYLAKDSLSLDLPKPWGFSNHGDPMQCVEAVKLGAVIVEQHFRIDEGLDLCAALPGEFKAMVEAIRKVERCES